VTTNQTDAFEKALLSLNKLAARNLISEIAQAEGAMQCVEKLLFQLWNVLGQNGKKVMSPCLNFI